MMGGERGTKNRPSKEPILPTNKGPMPGTEERAVREQLRSDLLALEEEIPGSSNPKARELRDPDEEMAVIERKLATRHSILNSLSPNEIRKRYDLEKEILDLEADFEYYKKKKRPK